jgi:hypothetical protein
LKIDLGARLDRFIAKPLSSLSGYSFAPIRRVRFSWLTARKLGAGGSGEALQYRSALSCLNLSARAAKVCPLLA